jgi:hypothetical protein
LLARSLQAAEIRRIPRVTGAGILSLPEFMPDCREPRIEKPQGARSMREGAVGPMSACSLFTRRDKTGH